MNPWIIAAIAGLFLFGAKKKNISVSVDFETLNGGPGRYAITFVHSDGTAYTFDSNNGYFQTQILKAGSYTITQTKTTAADCACYLESNGSVITTDMQPVKAVTGLNSLYTLIQQCR